MSTKSFARASATLLLAAVGLSLGACASTAPSDGSQYLADQQRPSTIPWNTPAKWEGQGALGAFGGSDRFSSR